MSGKTYNEALRDIVDEYRSSGNPWPADRRTIAAWAIEQGKWKPKETDIIDILGRDLSQAMRTQFFIDEQGRKVRKK